MKRSHLCLALLLVLVGIETRGGLPGECSSATDSLARPTGTWPEYLGEPDPALADSATFQSQTLQEQVAKLIAADSMPGDLFGTSVSVDGDTALVGAINAAGHLGAAYVFQQNEGGPNAWGQVAKLLGDDDNGWESLGSSVSLDGDMAIIGAVSANVGGNTAQGAAYIFYRAEDRRDAWAQVVKLTAADGAKADHFGTSVSVSGDVAVVGASGASVGGTLDQGAAYVFYRNQGGPDAWGQVAKLTADDGGTSDWFGSSVSISGDAAIVGAYYADVGGNQHQGAAYVYYRNQGGPDAWGQVAKLTASDGAPWETFGFSVSLDDETAIVATPFMQNLGAAYVFYRDQGGPNAWGQVAKLVAADGAYADCFGWSVALDGDVVIVGAYEDDVGGIHDAGSAYLFYRDQGGPDQWGQMAKLTADDRAQEDLFGRSVAVSGGTAVVGADYADVGGYEDQGAAYVYTWPSLHLEALFLAQFPGPWPGTHYLLALARVQDENHLPTSGVAVSGEWTLPDGQVRPKEAVTRLGGMARFLSLSGQTGTHKFCVTDLEKEGYLYNPGGDEVPACQTIEVGP